MAKEIVGEKYQTDANSSASLQDLTGPQPGGYSSKGRFQMNQWTSYEDIPLTQPYELFGEALHCQEYKMAKISSSCDEKVSGSIPKKAKCKYTQM